LLSELVIILQTQIVQFENLISVTETRQKADRLAYTARKKATVKNHDISTGNIWPELYVVHSSS